MSGRAHKSGWPETLGFLETWLAFILITDQFNPKKHVMFSKHEIWEFNPFKFKRNCFTKQIVSMNQNDFLGYRLEAETVRINVHLTLAT